MPREATRYESVYVNADYSFSVNLPPNLIGFGSVPPAPNHGFVAFVGHSEACIYVEAFYVNPDDSRRLHEFIKRHRMPVGSRGLDQMETAHTLSRPLEACDGRRGQRMRETLVAIANEGVVDGFPVEEIEYRVTLDSDTDAYRLGRAVLERLAAGFRRYRKN